MPTIEDKLNDLLSLRPNRSPQNPERCLALARQYLRLETLWMKLLDVPDDAFPCVDLATQMGQCGLPEQVDRDFRESNFAQSTVEAVACCNYLRWCCLKIEEPDSFLRSDLDDPFVPLIELFREGAQFSLEGWMFDVLKCGGINVRALRTKVLAE